MHAMEAALFERINSTVIRINQETERLTNSVDRALRLLVLPGARQALESAWQRFCEMMRRLWDELARILSHLGSPGALSDAAERWNDGVAEPVSKLAGMADRDNTEVNRYWEGHAAEAYLDTLPTQRTAIEGMTSTFTVPISTALQKLASAILIFFAALVAALLSLVAGIVTGVIGAAGVVTAPAAVAAVVAAVLVAIGAITGGAAKLMSEAGNQNNTLQQQLADNTAFRDAAWPRSTIEG